MTRTALMATVGAFLLWWLWSTRKREETAVAESKVQVFGGASEENTAETLEAAPVSQPWDGLAMPAKRWWRSNTADLLRLDNRPPPDVWADLGRTARAVEELEALHPLLVSSGYRCLLVNRAVGGAIKGERTPDGKMHTANSEHMHGRACDVVPRGDSGGDLWTLAEAARAMGTFSKVYPEATWLHLEIPEAAS